MSSEKWLANDGTVLKPGLVFESQDGAEQSLVVGFSKEGRPVLQKLEGWGVGKFFEVHNRQCQFFIDRLLRDYRLDILKGDGNGR